MSEENQNIDQDADPNAELKSAKDLDHAVAAETIESPEEHLLVEPFAPVTRTDRYEVLDVIRGFAILGILMPNIQAFSMISAAYGNPLAYGDFTGANFAVWVATHLFFEQKFMSLFSMMFGAGILLMSRRAEQKQRKGFWKIHYRRMFWLLLIGIMHAHIFWFGDILFCYAVSGALVYWLRRLPPVWLVVIGIFSMSISSAIFAAVGILIQFAPEEFLTGMEAGWKPPVEKVDAEVEAYRGDWFSQASYRSVLSAKIQLGIVPFIFMWRAGGLMLIGMALFKWGFITGEARTQSYRVAILVAVFFALPLVGWEMWKNYSVQWDAMYSQFFGIQVNYWVAPLVSIGYISMFALICRFQILGWVRKAFAAVGQMALTNYLGQTVICTTIFYGHGLGWFGYLERSDQFLVVVSVWTFQLIVSPLWMSVFRFGPAEWAWRSLSYWKIQPMRRS